MWIVNAIAPGPMANTGWDFRFGFFPREVAYKRDAEELAAEARSKGGIDVSITPDAKTLKARARRKATADAYASNGMVRVKGALGGTYYE